MQSIKQLRKPDLGRHSVYPIFGAAQCSWSDNKFRKFVIDKAYVLWFIVAIISIYYTSQ
jgi:hypothetical protein